MKKHSWLVLFAVFTLMFAFGCGEEGDTTTDGDSNTTDGDDVADAGSVIVTFEGADDVTVQLSDIAVEDVDGVEAVQAFNIVMDSQINHNLVNVYANFESADGFDPSSKDNCADFLPVNMDTLKMAYVETETNNLIWKEDANAPGCAHVDGLNKIKLMVGDGKPLVCDPNKGYNYTGGSKAGCDKVVGVCENAWDSDSELYGPCAEDPDCCCDLENVGDLFDGGSYDCQFDSCKMDGYCDTTCMPGVDGLDCGTAE